MGNKITMDIHEGGCWICQIPVNSAGYPTIKRNGKISTVHRTIYETAVGPIPKGMIVRHICDNKRCIKPIHLEIGTYADNAHDRDERGHTALGENNGNSKLTRKDVFAIRESTSYSQVELAKLFGVDRKTIRDIKQGKTWRWLVEDGQTL